MVLGYDVQIPISGSTLPIITKEALEYPSSSSTEELVKISRPGLGIAVDTPILQSIMNKLATLETRLDNLEKALESIRDELDEHPSTYNVQIFDLNSSSFKLRYPLLAVIERYPEEIIARLPQFDIYASAETDALALTKIKAELLNTYERLEELGIDRLGPLPSEWLNALTLLVERVSE